MPGLPHTGVVFNVTAARVLLSGLLAGAAGGVAATGITVLALVGNPGVRARLPAEMRFGLVGVVAANAMLFVWTLIGLVLGAVYLRAAQPGFSLGVVAGAGALLAAAVYVRRRVTWPMWSAAVVAVLAFAVMLPALAGAR